MPHVDCWQAGGRSNDAHGRGGRSGGESCAAAGLHGSGRGAAEQNLQGSQHAGVNCRCSVDIGYRHVAGKARRSTTAVGTSCSWTGEAHRCGQGGHVARQKARAARPSMPGHEGR